MSVWFWRVMDAVGSVLPALLLAVVLVVVSANVFARTVLGVSFHTAHDLSLIAFAGVVWFGVIGAAMRGQLFGVAYFVDLLPPRLRLAARLAAHVVVILIAAAIIHAAYAQISTARFTRFLALGWPKWIVSAGLLAAMVGLIAVQAQQAWQAIRAARETRP